MSLFMEDPAHFSKSRLKSDLVAHNVVLPPTKSRKEIYVDLHSKHIAQKNAGDFSSDDEDQEKDLADKEEDAEILVQSCLTDDDLKAALLKHGVKAGPIVASTRALYENKLRRLQQSEGQGHVNRVEKGVLYSDSEDEEEQGEQGEQEDGESVAYTGSEGAKEEIDELSNQAQQGSSQKGDFVYPQCFLLSSRMRPHATRKWEPIPKRNSRNVIKSSQQIPVGITKASSVDQRAGLGSGFPSGTHSAVSNGGSAISPQQSFSITEMVQEMEKRKSLSSCPNTERELNGSNVQEHWSRFNRPSQEPVKDTIKEMFLNMEASPTGICATRRRPIKGAAGRPVQYIYPESPTTIERREVERRLVPIHIQILFFFIVACLLYIIYVCVEENSFSPFVALLDSPDQEGLVLQAETQDTPVISGQE
nr:LEM domain-containing protein 1 isoform X2 [Pseudochaenichthys georgianus]